MRPESGASLAPGRVGTGCTPRRWDRTRRPRGGGRCWRARCERSAPARSRDALACTTGTQTGEIGSASVSDPLTPLCAAGHRPADDPPRPSRKARRTGSPLRGADPCSRRTHSRAPGPHSPDRDVSGAGGSPEDAQPAPQPRRSRAVAGLSRAGRRAASPPRPAPRGRGSAPSAPCPASPVAPAHRPGRWPRPASATRCRW